MDGAHSRTLQRALEAVGGEARLAVVLDVPLDELRAYIAAEKPLPHRLFIDALDIVSGVPLRHRNHAER